MGGFEERFTEMEDRIGVLEDEVGIQPCSPVGERTQQPTSQPRPGAAKARGAGSLLRLPDGRTLSYLDSGDPTGHPVIHLHGTSRSRLDRLREAEGDRRAGIGSIAIDRAGFGRSDFRPGRRVTGTVRAFHIVGFEVDLDDTLLEELEGDLVLVADNVPRRKRRHRRGEALSAVRRRARPLACLAVSIFGSVATGGKEQDGTPRGSSVTACRSSSSPCS